MGITEVYHGAELPSSVRRGRRERHTAGAFFSGSGRGSPGNAPRFASTYSPPPRVANAQAPAGMLPSPRNGEGSIPACSTVPDLGSVVARLPRGRRARCNTRASHFQLTMPSSFLPLGNPLHAKGGSHSAVRAGCLGCACIIFRRHRGGLLQHVACISRRRLRSSTERGTHFSPNGRVRRGEDAGSFIKPLLVDKHFSFRGSPPLAHRGLGAIFLAGDGFPSMTAARPAGTRSNQTQAIGSFSKEGILRVRNRTPAL